MNKELIINRFSKARNNYNKEAIVQFQIALKTMNLLEKHGIHNFQNILEIGCGTGFLTRQLLNKFHPENITLNDICPDMEACFTDLVNKNVSFSMGDAEVCQLPNNRELIASCSTIQWFADLERFFERCLSLLEEKGYLVFSTFGKDNMKEITASGGDSLAYYTLEELRRILSSHYHVIYSEEEIIKQKFESPLHVLYHLKQTGVTGINRKVWTKGDLLAFCRKYTDNFRDGNIVPLTYHPIYIIAQKR